MKKKTLFALWGGLYVLCAGLGFLPAPAGALRVVLTVCSLLFFLPPAWLLWKGDKQTALLIRNLSAASLLATLIALILNFVGAFGSETVGNALHALLTVVSAPMLCSGYWVLSLFLWACLLMASRKKSK